MPDNNLNGNGKTYVACEEFMAGFNNYLCARATVIFVVTIEEARVMKYLKKAVTDGQNRYRFVSWNAAEGFKGDIAVKNLPEDQNTPLAALSLIERDAAENKTPAVFVLNDFHEFYNAPGHQGAQIRRKLKALAQSFKKCLSSIVITTHSTSVPTEFKGESLLLLEFTLPVLRDYFISPWLDSLAGKVFEMMSSSVGETEDIYSIKERLAQSLLGMTMNQAEITAAKVGKIMATITVGEKETPLDAVVKRLNEEKKNLVRETNAVQIYPADDSNKGLGGLEVLKHWLKTRRGVFSEKAREYGLEMPKGLVFIGAPGVGKSLGAKYISAFYNIPLLRLEFGLLFDSLLGATEERLRKVLKLAESVAPCVLWIDEAEKALAAGGLDGGTSERVLGSILTWMQEKQAPVFCVFTVNSVKNMPKELLRKGRVDEILYFDLPSFSERYSIFGIHVIEKAHRFKSFELPPLPGKNGFSELWNELYIKKMQFRGNKFVFKSYEEWKLDLIASRPVIKNMKDDLDKNWWIFYLSDVSEGFSGSEIEFGVIEAMHQGFSNEEGGGEPRKYTVVDIFESVIRQVPLSVSFKDHIIEMRQLLVEKRVKSASFGDDDVNNLVSLS